MKNHFKHASIPVYSNLSALLNVHRDKRCMTSWVLASRPTRHLRGAAGQGETALVASTDPCGLQRSQPVVSAADSTWVW